MITSILRETEFPKNNIHSFAESSAGSSKIIHIESSGHAVAHVRKYTGNQGFPESPESDRVDCLDARNFPRPRVTSKLLSCSRSSHSYRHEVVGRLLISPSSSLLLSLSALLLSFCASTLDSEERVLSDSKISDRRNCLAPGSYHVVAERSVVRVFRCHTIARRLSPEVRHTECFTGSV